LRSIGGSEKFALLILALPVKAGFCSWREASEMNAEAFFRMLEAVFLAERYGK
jgi:hypothetical protein